MLLVIIIVATGDGVTRMPELLALTVPQAAKALQISTPQAYRMVADGDLTRVRCHPSGVFASPVMSLSAPRTAGRGGNGEVVHELPRQTRVTDSGGPRYRAATHPQKSVVLDEFVAA